MIQILFNYEIIELYESLTGTQKCAILMMLLGEEEAAEIMKNLNPKEVQTLGTAMYSVQGLPQETVNMVLDEFLSIIKAQTSLGIAGDSYIKNVLIYKILAISYQGSVRKALGSQLGYGWRNKW